ncbi:tyrosine-type recombinase/integrase [Planosporangium sp. 12N6]|uniref:tyrosine-type recombinase/integrase n=1 Tax=Planosporangium spinosum TaxID=3402278 RepID=UPI003CF07FAB
MTDQPAPPVLAGEILPAGNAVVPATETSRTAGPDVDALVRQWLVEYPSKHTRDAYRRDLAEWLSYCDNSGLEPVVDPTRTHVAAWLRLREELRESNSTRARRLAAVSAWYRWLLATGHRNPEAGNPATALDARNKPKMRPLTSAAALTRDEAERLLAAADADTGGAGLRTPAIVALLLYCGLRVSELVHADLDQLGYDRGHRVLRFITKGGQPHVVPLPASVLRRLDPYLASRPDLAGDRLPTHFAGVRPARPLFATVTGGRLDRGAVWRLLRRLAKRAGIKVTMSPHVLRATCATLSRDAGAALDQVQELLGHSDPRVTAGYDRRAGRLDHSPALVLQRFLHDPADAAPAGDSAA